MDEPGKIDVVDNLVADWRRENPSLRAEAMQVVGRIIRLGRLYQDQVSTLLKPHELSYSDFDVLATLRRSGHPFELTPTELQQSVLLTSGAMTACLRRLEDAQLITRRGDAEDGRRSSAKLSRRGQALVEKLIHHRFELAREELGGLSAREAAALVDLLRKLDGSAG
jgi:DNA-binding MarR family transcriptional regulator